MSTQQTANDYFRTILLTVIGQAFTAADYHLQEFPVQWAGGMFRFRKHLENGLYAFIEFQTLNYVDSEWSNGAPSRFRVTLIRSDLPEANRASQHPQFVRRLLSELVVVDFAVAILPGASHWWTYSNTQELGNALAEAGHLAIGYGMPWLAGDLQP